MSGVATLVVRGGQVLSPHGWIDGADVAVDGGRVAAIGRALPAGAARLLDARERLVVPGFVDVHVHGAAGAMFEDADVQGSRRALECLATMGTTSVVATVAALPAKALLAAVRALAEVGAGAAGARVLGIHLEGPFLNPLRAGAQRPEWMRPPSLAELDALQAACGGRIRVVTVAPELPGAAAFIAGARARGVRVALGHSEASADEVALALAAGATHVTHLFNAMAGLHHRRPGLVGMGLADDRLSVEVIADGVHVDPIAVRLAARSKREGRMVLVSDGVAAVGAAAGPLRVFGAPCTVGDAVRRDSDGQLVGSCLTLAGAVRNLRAWLPEWPLERVVAAATAAPARVAGCADQAGGLVAGAAADLLLLDQDLRVRGVVCRGQVLAGD